MKSILRFIIIAITGKAGIEAIAENKIAGFIFFFISFGAFISLLEQFGVNIPKVLDWIFIIVAVILYIRLHNRFNFLIL